MDLGGKQFAEEMAVFSEEKKIGGAAVKTWNRFCKLIFNTNDKDVDVSMDMMRKEISQIIIVMN